MTFLWKCLCLAAVAGTRIRSRDNLDFRTAAEAHIEDIASADAAQVSCSNDRSRDADRFRIRCPKLSPLVNGSGDGGFC